MLLGLGTSIMLGLGIRTVWGRKANVATIAAIGTGAVMYGVYESKLHTMEKQISK